MIKFLDYNKKNFLKRLENILNIRKFKQQNKSAIVKKILLNVKKKGDKAVLEYEKKFSKIKINNKKLKFSKKEIDIISNSIDKKLKKSIDIAYKRIKLFHSKQKSSYFK